MVDRFAQRYALAPAPPPAMSWREYARLLVDEWPNVLSRAQSEQEVQTFLEDHPCLLPGGEGGGDSFGGHHGPFPSAVVRQPELPGLTRPKPDFMWITKTSASIHPILIEIEDPSKKWYTSAGDPRAQLTQARNQINTWKAWFDNPAQVELFQQKYVLDDFLRRHLPLVPRYMLVYGRRDDATRSLSVNSTRFRQAGQDVEEMTFDRLAPQPTASNCVTVSARPDGWRVVSVPPTFLLGPVRAKDLLLMSGWEEAIDRNALISAERKAFLKMRIPYWREFAEERSGLVHTGDWE